MWPWDYEDNDGEGKEERWLEGGTRQDWQHRRKVFWNQQHGVRSACPHWGKDSEAAGTLESSTLEPPLPWTLDCEHKDMPSSTPSLPRETYPRPLLSSFKTNNLPFLFVTAPFSKENSAILSFLQRLVP